MGFPGGASGKEPTYQCRDLRDTGMISRSGKFPEGGHNNKLQYSFFFSPTPVSLPGESHGQRSLAGYSP